MTYEDQRIWSTLSQSARYWDGAWKIADHFYLRFEYELRADNLLVERVREDWDLIKNIASERIDAKKLPRPETIVPRNPEVEKIIQGLIEGSST